MIFSQLNRPMRAGGFALIGVAAVALVIGTASAITGDGDDSAEPAAPTDGPEAGDGQEGPIPVPGDEDGNGPDDDDGDGESPTTTTPGQDGDDESPDDGAGNGDGADDDGTSPDSRPGSPGGADRSSAPGSSNGNERVGSSGSGDDGKQHRSVAVRVYNNSTISGLAGEVSDDLRASGWNVVATNNYSGGKIPTTTAYYRPGTGEKSAAEAIAREFDMRVEPRFEGISDASGGVIVIATNDYQGPSGKS